MSAGSYVCHSSALTGVCAQEMGLVNEWVSETIFNTLFVSFVVWTFSPFWTATKRFYTAVIYARLLMVLCGAWSLYGAHGAVRPMLAAQ